MNGPMNDEELAKAAPIAPALQPIMNFQAANAQPAPIINLNLNLNVGLARLVDRPLVDPGLANIFGRMTKPSKPSPDLFRLWSKLFSPVGNPKLVVQIPKD